MNSGVRRKNSALAAVGARHAGDVLRAQVAMVRVLLAREACTIDHVRAALNLPDVGRPTWLGAVPAGLRAAGVIRKRGYEETRRACAHARPLAVWELIDADRGRKWLELNDPSARSAQGRLW